MTALSSQAPRGLVSAGAFPIHQRALGRRKGTMPRLYLWIAFLLCTISAYQSIGPLDSHQAYEEGFYPNHHALQPK